MNKRDKALLRRIRARVLRTDWTKGAYHKPKGTPKVYGGNPDKDTYCLVGLVNKESGIDPNGGLPPAYWSGDWTKRQAIVAKQHRANRIKEALVEAVVGAGLRKRKPRNLESFNDARPTKREDIVAVLDYILDEDV